MVEPFSTRCVIIVYTITHSRKPKHAPRWLYAIAIVGILFVLAIALLIRFAPKVLIFW